MLFSFDGEKSKANSNTQSFCLLGKEKKNTQFFLKAYQARTGISELMEQVLSGELVRPERSNSVQLSSEIFRGFLVVVFQEMQISEQQHNIYTFANT